MSLLAFYFIGDSVFGPLRQRYEFPPERTTACREQRPPVRRLYGTQPGLKRLLRPGCVEKVMGVRRPCVLSRPSVLPLFHLRLPVRYFGFRPGTPFGKFCRTPGPAARRGSDDDVDDLPGTTITFLGALPSSHFCASGSATTAAWISAGVIATAYCFLKRSLPLTDTGYSKVLRTR